MNGLMDSLAGGFVSGRRTMATAKRVLHQLRHDPRTLLLIVGVPILLVTLIKYVFDDSPEVFQQFGPIVLGIFPFTVMFVVTSITTLRERTSGTLERLLAMPTAKLDLLLGYAIAFGIMAVIQALAVSAVALGPLDLNVQGSVVSLVAAATLDGLLGMALGLFVSAFAQTEFQAVQFMPAVVLPQYLLCGLFVDRDQMAPVLQMVSDYLPLSYSVDMIDQVAADPAITGELVGDFLVVLAFGVGALVLGAATLRRRSA